MNTFKEFQGKSLDEAIETACDYFNLERGKLEIEILSGGSTGIFGLVGVKKATIKARPRPGLKEEFEPAPQNSGTPEPQEVPAVDDEYEEDEVLESDEEDFDDEDEAGEYEDEAEEYEGEVDEEILEAERDYERARLARVKADNGDQESKRHRKPVQPAPRRKQPEPQAVAEPAQEEYTGPDPVLVEETVREVLTHLLLPVTGNEPVLSFTREAGRFDVFVDDDENSGLIIGREGQTLSALQYLVNRIVSRKLEAPVRIQIDTGDYRERQNEGLRRLALQLADKAKNYGRPQSTRPLSSYHRRVVHMALQNDSGIQTRSKGDGPLKKVLILPNRRRGGNSGGRGQQRRESQFRERW